MIPELAIAVRFAETRLADLISQNEFQTLDFSAYGKNFMTSMGFSPDAYVQMAFQAAYYGLYGRVECSYEPAATKIFLHGRTEAIRTVTPEVVEFVQSFWGENPPAQKIEALKKACQRHVANTKECARAQGCDRHLYALFSVWQRAVDEDGAEAASSNGFSSPSDGGSEMSSPRLHPIKSEGEPDHNNNNNTSSPGRNNATSMPAIFADGGWDKLNNTILSTSNCGNPSLRQFGFGPTSGDGFGIGYIIKDEAIAICASSKHRQTKRFVDALESYLLEMRKLLRSTQRNTSGPKGSRAREASPSRARMTGSKVKSRGRLIKSEVSSILTPTSTESDDDGLGGCELSLFPSFLFSFLSSLSHKDCFCLQYQKGEKRREFFWLTSDAKSTDGFFDSGMLFQALKARDDAFDEKDSEKGRKGLQKWEIGKKLRLSEY
jgi:carnitine O-acetyltransferase